MRDISRRHENYRPPDPVEVPPLFRWPPQLLIGATWFITRHLYPWGFFYIALAFFAWHYLTPDYTRMTTLSADWIALLWLRNAALLTAVAGGLHWHLHMRRAQGKRFKYDQRWLAKNSKRFWFRNQTRENLFFSVVSGVTIWTAWEAGTLWAMASGRIGSVSIAEAPAYGLFLIVLTFFWSTFHFEFAHRPLHWKSVYRIAHALHHKNVNTGPWSGISMHPLEHLIYFSVFCIWWVVPADPVVIALCAFLQGISPAVSHCGFEQIEVGRKFRIHAGTHFHTLHHQLFEVNYGNQLTPTDRLLDTWHDGSDEAYEKFRHRGPTMHSG